MRRPFLVALLTFGTIAGFSSGFHRMHHCREQWREAEEARTAETCATAALAQVRYAPNGAFAPSNGSAPAASNPAVSAVAAPAVAAAAAPGPAFAPIQQISQAPAPIVIVTGGYPSQPASVQVLTQPAAPAAASAPSVAPTVPATPTK